MYYWSIKKLKKQIIDGDLSENILFKYLVAYTIIMGLSAVPIIVPNAYDIFSAILIIPISVLGLLYAYSVNGGDSGQDFIKKYFSIGFVLGVRFFAITMLIVIVLAGYIGGTGDDLSASAELFSILLSAAIYAFYYWRLATHIQDTNTSLPTASTGE